MGKFSILPDNDVNTKELRKFALEKKGNNKTASKERWVIEKEAKGGNYFGGEKRDDPVAAVLKIEMPESIGQKERSSWFWGWNAN